MPKFEKGQGGRKPGSLNKINKTVKETVLEVFNILQDDPKHNLEAFAKKQPVEFYRIASKLIPTELTAQVEHTGGVQIYIPDNSRDGSQPPPPAE